MGKLYIGKDGFDVDKLVKGADTITGYLNGIVNVEVSGIDWNRTDIRWKSIEPSAPELSEADALRTRLEFVEEALIMLMDSDK